MQQRFRIRSLVYEFINPDGTVEDVYLEDTDVDMGYIKFLTANPADVNHDQQFWIASSHDGLTDGTNVIASNVPGAAMDPEVHMDRTNTMIGLIRDKACNAYVVYSPDPVSFVKP